MRQKEHYQNRLKQQEYAEFMIMKKAEERYQEALEKLLASGREEKSFARKKNERDRLAAEACKQSVLEYQKHLKAQLIKEAKDYSALEEQRKQQVFFELFFIFAN